MAAGRPRPWLFALLALAGAVLLLGGGYLLRDALRSRPPPPTAAAPAPLTPEAVLAGLQADPQSQAVVAAFRETFPQEWAAMTADITTRVRAGEGRDQVARAAFERMRGFAFGRADALASAPTAQLTALAQAYLDLAIALQRTDRALCGRFAFSGFTAYDLGRFPEAGKAPLARAIAAQLRATRAGLDHPVRRPDYGAARQQAFMAAYQRVDGDVNVLRVGSAYHPQACEAGVAIYHAVLSLPPDEGAATLAYIVTSAVPPPATAP